MTIPSAAELRATSAALRARELRFHALFDSSFHFTALLAPDGTVLELNRAALELAGDSAEPVIDRPFCAAAWWHGTANRDVGERIREAVTAAAAGQFVRFDMELSHGPEIIVLDVSLRCVRDESSEIILLAAEWRDVTEQRADEAAARESEERIHLIVDGVRDHAIYMLDEGGRVATWNSGAERLKGFRAQEIIGQHYETLFTPEQRLQGHPAALLEAARTQGSVSGEGTRVRRDGSSFAAEISITALFDTAGKLRGYSKVTRDITERRIADDALRASEARFRITADTLPNLLFETDSSGRTVYVNTQFAKYTGLDPAELCEDGWLQTTHPDDEQRAAETLAKAVLTAKCYEVEYRIQRHDGHYRWFLGRGAPVRDPSGRVSRWVGSCTDIDDQKQAATVLKHHRDELEQLVLERTADLSLREQQLRESEARFRLLAEHAGDMVSRIGANGAVQYVSPSSQRIFGVTPEFLIANGFMSRIHADDRAAVAALRNQLLSGAAETGTLSFRILHPELGEVWVEAGLSLLRDAQTGTPDGYVAALRDVTDRKRMEDKLRHGQKMEAIGRIAAGVAHDFNNILQAVLGGLELALDDLEPGTQPHEFASIAMAAGKRGSYLTHHLLSYARKQILLPRALDLGPFLGDMQKLLSRTLGPHIAISVSVPGDAPAIRVDPNQLQTALLNLAINAAHAMPEGGALSIEASAFGTDGEPVSFVVLSISDTGTGMNEQTLEQACEPFFTTKGLDGTGLGLSMVQGFAEQSGGYLTITSAPEEGTTVRLRLPAVLTVRQERKPENHNIAQAAAHILLVDDDAEVLVTTGAFMQKAGLRVTRASSGDEALRLIATGERFDALVTDYAMPGMNGVDLALEVQTFWPGLPALIITGFAEVRGKAPLPEGVRLLHKPFKRVELLAALSDIIVQTPGSGAGPDGVTIANAT